MNKTKIEWTDYTSNPVKGLCPMACPYCYARAMYKRFKWNPEIRFEPEEMLDWATVPDGSKIFVGSTIELFGDWVKHEWMEEILWFVRRCPWATFQFLTKQPQNLAKFSPFPDNCWVGVSATTDKQYMAGLKGLRDTEARIKFISFEPLLEEVINQSKHHGFCNLLSFCHINWVIIGAQTGPGAKPPMTEWVWEIIKAADQAKVPLFLKDNLLKHFPELPRRQEFPNKEAHDGQSG